MHGVPDSSSLFAEAERGRELLQQGRPAQAVRELRRLAARAAELPPSATTRELRARIDLGLAAGVFEITGRLEEASELLDEARRLADDARAEHLVVPIEGQRGLLLLRSGDYRRARVALDRAGSSLEAAAPYDRMTLLLNRGSLHLEDRRLPEALEDLERCSALAEEHGVVTLAWKARHNLGWAEFLAGRIPGAISTLERAEALNPGAAHPVGKLDRARVLREAGLLVEASELLEDVAEDLRRAALWQDLAEAELARAECLLVRGELDVARDLARRARRRFVDRGNRTWQRRAELLLLRTRREAIERRAAGGTPLPARRAALRRLSSAAALLGDRCRAERRTDLARQADLIAREAELRARVTLSSPVAPVRAPATVGAGRPAPAVRRRDPLGTRLLTREVRALAAEAAGDRRRARAEVGRGLAELDGYQHSFGSLDLRTASAVHGSALARLGLDLVLRDGGAADVLRFVERARAVSTRLPQVRPPGDAATADLVARLRAAEEAARAAEGDPSARETTRRLRREATDLQREIRRRAWELAGGDGRADDAPRVGRIAQAAAEADAAFVSLARHQGSWIAVTVVGRRCRLVRLGPVAEVAALVARVRADLDAAARPSLPAPLRQAVRRSLAVGLGRLDDLLLAPLGLGDRRLVLSCSGDLVLLPWGLLPSRSGCPTSVVPSAAAWLRAARRRRPATPRVVAVAGPDLRLADAEATDVAGRWSDGHVLRGGEATARATCAALVSADLVHVSAHGRHRSDSPLFSSVRLHDGSLYAHEIDPGAGLAGCVVLSACDAGLATTRPGEEMLGLAQVLLHLGASSVVAAVARVNDEVSAGVMASLHDGLARGIDVSTSLAAANRESVESSSPAAFVSYGASW